jgi:hypothetical protein
LCKSEYFYNLVTRIIVSQKKFVRLILAEKSKESSKGFLPVRSRNEPNPSDEVVLSE